MFSFGRPSGSLQGRAGRWVLVAGAMVAALAANESVHARPRHRDPDAVGVVERSVSLASLPAEARTTYRLIQADGPFPYPKDGVVFSNRERSLPRQARGFYHEYTVRTPGAHDRGARRIVCGGGPRSGGESIPAPAVPNVCYYTSDHYATFARIVN